MRLLSEADVDNLADRNAAVDAADEAFRLHAESGMSAPGRIDIRGDGARHGVLNLVALGTDGSLSVKTNVHSFQGEPAFRHSASLLTLWDAVACKPLALIAGSRFNQHRTAAGFAAACRRLAPANCSTLVVFGAGHMAPETIRYMVAIRPIRSVIVVSRDAAKAARLVQQAAEWPDLAGISICVETDARAAAGRADIVVAVTSSDTPVFPGDAVRPGTFVVLGGANRPTAREADDILIRRATIYVDHLAGCLERSGDLRIPLASGVLSKDQIVAEIGALSTNDIERPHADVTVFKSIGIATQDLVLGRWLLDRAGHETGMCFDIAGETDPRPASQVVRRV